MTGWNRVRSLSGADDGGFRVVIRDRSHIGELTSKQAKKESKC
jgi:hypothetical protein